MTTKSAAPTPNTKPTTLPTNRQRTIALLSLTQPSLLLLRDGEVVLYRRTRSLLYQCRFKLADGKWHRFSTRRASLESAITAACDLYDEARYRQRLGLTHRAHSVAQIAAITLLELRRQIDGSSGRGASNTYVTCIEKYFIPYFGDKMLEELTHTDMREFELWRDRQMARKPKTSTLNNFTSAWNRLIATAVERGYISERVPVPKLTAKGVKGTARPAFSEEEIAQLFAFMDNWTQGGTRGNEHEIRLLLRDYIEMLLLTGMRHGTEAMGICWRHLEWHTDKGVRYLRIWVDGKTGGRWLIAKHRAVEVLKRLHARQTDVNSLALEDMIASRVPQKLFRLSDGYQPVSLNGTFRRLLRDAGLLTNSEGHTRTLYSIRHTYATLEPLRNSTDIHTLSRQMGNSALMIERHYSKLTATMAADRLA